MDREPNKFIFRHEVCIVGIIKSADMHDRFIYHFWNIMKTSKSRIRAKVMNRINILLLDLEYTLYLHILSIL